MSFPEPGLFLQILKHLARKRGYRFASREIESLVTWKRPLSEIQADREVTPLHKELKYRTNDPASFKGGWSDRWRELGEADATDGVCRSSLFSNDQYDLGWFGMVRHRKKQGWENDRLTADFDRLHQRYSGHQG